MLLSTENRDSTNIPTLAVFDFDGTITLSDTFNDFNIWRFGRLPFYMAMLIASPLITLYLLGMVKNDIPKAFLFRLFFKGLKNDSFEQSCKIYASTRLNILIRENAISRIEWHAKQGHILIINSASITNWISPWANEKGFSNVIATNVEVQRGVLTGKFSTSCCYGMEKLLRLRALYPSDSYAKMYVYGDSRGDKEILSVADFPAFRVFHE